MALRRSKRIAKSDQPLPKKEEEVVPTTCVFVLSYTQSMPYCGTTKYTEIFSSLEAAQCYRKRQSDVTEYEIVSYTVDQPNGNIYTIIDDYEGSY